METGETALGTVAYTDTKTGPGRVVPLHPEAERALRAAMLPEPEDAGERAVWSLRPVFQRLDGKPWEQSSYRSHWRKLRGRLVKRWPDLAGIRLRDLRNAAITDMRDRGADPAAVAKLAGHSERMNAHYTQVTGPAAREAVMSLGCQVVT